MNQKTKCPQCGTDFTSGYNTPIICPMCGWGKDENFFLSPPSGFSHFWNTKSIRWRTGAVAALFLALIVITPLINLGRNQLMANHAVALAKSQMDKRLYASAVRTLNQAPRSMTTGTTKQQMNGLLSDTLRWAHDISDVATAKKSIVAVQPEKALDTLDTVDEDFPQENEAVDLIDLAQDQSIDPEIEVNDQIVDDIAYVPDDPEMDNLGELSQQAEEQLNGTSEEATPSAQPETATQTSTTGEQQTATTSEANSETSTDPSADDPSLSESSDEPPEEELPDSPDPVTPSTPATTTSKPTGLVPFYQLNWFNNPKNPTDQDTFYTTDLNTEVKQRKDKRSNATGYDSGTVIGQIYNRKVVGNPNIVPLYRYYSASHTSHYFTTISKFASNNKSANYVRQQVAGYIGKWDGQKCLAGNIPLYGIYSPKLTDNFATTSVPFRDALVANAGWKYPKVTGCIW